MEDAIPPEPDETQTKVSTLRLRFPGRFYAPAKVSPVAHGRDATQLCRF